MANGPYDLTISAQLFPSTFKPLTFGAGLQGEAKWFWLWCANLGCQHHVPMAYAPFAIRWGPHATLDTIRQRARCKVCGNKGANITLPSWAGTATGWAEFPAT